MRKVNFFIESSSGMYSKILFDLPESTIIVERQEKSVSALDYPLYGLQKNIERYREERITCFEDIHEELIKRAGESEADNILIAFDENGWWNESTPIWKIQIRYQFLIKKD